MPMFNRMSELLDKIERRLGVKPLNLPEEISKDHWAKDIITIETLDTFSRYFPYAVTYNLRADNKKGDVYLIDEGICESFDILGVGDIDWHEFSAKSPAYQYGGGYGCFDFLSESYDVEDIMMTQMVADHTSLFSNGIYVEYIPPNMVKLSTAMRVDTLGFMQVIPIKLFVKHAKNLMTIEPTKMETFEKLAICDVAEYLFNYLKYYDNVDTVYATTDLRLNRLEEVANRRDEVIEELKAGYVNPANKNQPVMFCIN